LLKTHEHAVDVIDGEHDAEVTEGIYRSIPMIGNHSRRKESRQLDPTVAVGRTQHGNFDALVVQPGDAPRPLAFYRGLPLEDFLKRIAERDPAAPALLAAA
jgi:hypothetical protein